MHNLSALFEPAGIVVVGASASPGKLGAAMAESLASFPSPWRWSTAATPMTPCTPRWLRPSPHHRPRWSWPSCVSPLR
ncbi:hypothetical protein ACW0JT_07380 [Arthrobacter sp. SA17]